MQKERKSIWKMLQKTLDNAMLGKVKNCKSAKAIWDTITEHCDGSEQVKDNKLTLTLQKFDAFKMLPGETLDQFDTRFTEI
ncbi:hypothetical protein, partial [Aeromonas veronii]|uniref:hypothetical protein n=1 Tax=Aeromonas veronii TaxID=654 RepID=UPI00406C9FD8